MLRELGAVNPAEKRPVQIAARPAQNFLQHGFLFIGRVGGIEVGKAIAHGHSRLDEVSAPSMASASRSTIVSICGAVQMNGGASST